MHMFARPDSQDHAREPFGGFGMPGFLRLELRTRRPNIIPILPDTPLPEPALKAAPKPKKPAAQPPSRRLTFSPRRLKERLKVLAGRAANVRRQQFHHAK